MAQKATDSTSGIFMRPPVVTIMGHVDHGKTSLLDYIRKANVASGEAGGITQSIGAYQAQFSGKKITFIDTPGHAIFTQMRAHGGKASDIVVLVIAAEDGVMPQTKEAIAHAKAAGAQMIVAINKIDLPGANPQRIKQQLAEVEVLVEDWGGTTICVEVSAKTGLGVDKLLQSILALAEILELKADPSADLEGIIIESKLDPKRGAIFTGIVKNGTLKVGDEVYTSGVISKIRALIDYTGAQIKQALPGDPVEVLGFSLAPKVGELFVAARNKALLETAKVEVLEAEVIGNAKVVNLIVKSSTEGSLEALIGALKRLNTLEIHIRILHKGTGDVSESDILLAAPAKALVLGFNAKIPAKVADLAESLAVKVKTYGIVYELLEEMEDVLKEALYQEEVKVKGRAQVLQLFPLKSGDIVAGCKVLLGALKNNSKVSVFRSGTEEALFTGKIKELRRGKDIVSVVGKDVECGVMLTPVFSEIKSGDTIEVL